jgi:hypothetical protein
MTTPATKTERVSDVLARLGQCVELVPSDPHCQNITVGLYEKDGILTVWTFSTKEAAFLRMSQIRSQLVALGGLTPVPRTTNKVNFPCGYIHTRPLKFLTMQAVEKAPDYVLPTSPVKDLKSDLMLSFEAEQRNGQWVYRVKAGGQAPNVEARLRGVAAGLVRYGEMEKVSETEVAFVCGERHDKLVWLLLPFARNVSGVEDMLEAAALRGQMTTGTLGFTPN